MESIGPKTIVLFAFYSEQGQKYIRKSEIFSRRNENSFVVLFD